jgi:hypothetical protein
VYELHEADFEEIGVNIFDKLCKEISGQNVRITYQKEGETKATRSNEFQKRIYMFPDAQVVIVSISGHGYEAPVHAQPHYEPQYAAPIQEQYAPPTVQQQYVPPATVQQQYVPPAVQQQYVQPTVQQQYVPPTVQHQAPQPQHHQQLVDPYEVPIFKVKVARDGEANP